MCDGRVTKKKNYAVAKMTNEIHVIIRTMLTGSTKSQRKRTHSDHAKVQWSVRLFYHFIFFQHTRTNYDQRRRFSEPVAV